MKKIIIIALFFASSATAQNARVLICSPGDPASAQVTLASLQKVYSDKIDVSDTITDAINNYEAVFLLILNKDLTFDQGNLFKSFLKSNKKLYVEYGLWTFGFYHWDTSGFWKEIGVSHVGLESVESSIKDVEGVSGTFTEGFLAPNKNWGFDDVASVLYFVGNVTSVLFAENTLHLGYIFETDSFKVALHWKTIPFYYEAFLARVICNYFELCAPVSVKQSEESVPSISLYPNPARNVLHISGTGNTLLQSAELISSNGSIVSKFSLDPGQTAIDLGSLNLSSGNYYLRLETPKESWMEGLIINAK